MRIKNVFVHETPGAVGKLTANATVEVPGLGEVQFVSAMSEELCNTVREEVFAALRVRMGQQLEEVAK